MDRLLVPAEEVDGEQGADLDPLEVLRKRLIAYKEQEAAAMMESDPAASKEALDAAPKEVADLQVKHVAEFAVRTEQTMTDLRDEVEQLRSNLAKTQMEQRHLESDRTQIETAYKLLRDRIARQQDVERQHENARRGDVAVGPLGSQALPQHGAIGPHGPQAQHQHGAIGSNGPPAQQNAAPVQDPMELFRREMERKIEHEIGRRVGTLPSQARTLPPGQHHRRKRAWTPAEYLALIGERVADTDMGFNQGVAGQLIVPRTALPPLDSTLPNPLTEENCAPDVLREVFPNELQGPNRSRLMSNVYGGETSSHQKRLAFCFDSRDYRTWTAFFNEFKTLAGREGWTPIQRLNQLRSRISGQASATVNRVEHICGRMTSAEDLNAVCQYHVLGETAVTDSRAKLQSRARRPDETIREFAYALVDLAELAYPGEGQDHMHKACEKFIASVTKSTSIKKMLYRNFVGNPMPSIETLASIAIKAERSEEIVNQEMSMGTGLKNENSTTTFSSEKPQNKIQEFTSKQEVNPSEFPEWIAAMKNSSYHRKSRRDHSGSRSRSHSRSNSRHSRDRRSSKDRHQSSHSKDEDICYNCGGKGHYSPECPSPDKRKKYEEKNSKTKFPKKNDNFKKNDQKKSKRSSSKQRSRRNEIVKQVVDSVIAYYDNNASASEAEEVEESKQ